MKISEKEKFIKKISRKYINEEHKGVYFEMDIPNINFEMSKLPLSLDYKSNRLYIVDDKKHLTDEIAAFLNKESSIDDLTLDTSNLDVNTLHNLGLESVIYGIELNFITNSTSPVNFFIDVKIIDHKLTEIYTDIALKAKKIKESIKGHDVEFGLNTISELQIIECLILKEKLKSININI